MKISLGNWTKEENSWISDVLVKSMREHGHWVLGQGSGVLWHALIGNGAWKKASQALWDVRRGGVGCPLPQWTLQERNKVQACW